MLECSQTWQHCRQIMKANKHADERIKTIRPVNTTTYLAHAHVTTR